MSSQLLRASAVLGVKLIHASPRAATTKGKIERFFRTVRDQFLVEIDDGVELAELNRLFSAWLEVVYHRRTHSETGQTPLERFEAAGAPQLPTPALLREAFLWSQERTVTKTATVSLHGNSYEVDPALVGRKVERECRRNRVRVIERTDHAHIYTYSLRSDFLSWRGAKRPQNRRAARVAGVARRSRARRAG